MQSSASIHSSSSYAAVSGQASAAASSSTRASASSRKREGVTRDSMEEGEIRDERISQVSKRVRADTRAQPERPVSLFQRRTTVRKDGKSPRELLAETVGDLSMITYVRRFHRVSNGETVLEKMALQRRTLQLNVKDLERKIIRDVKDVQVLYQNEQDVPAPTRVLFGLLKKMDAFNLNQSAQSNREAVAEMSAEHARTRILLLFHIAVSYHAFTKKPTISCEGARLQILEGTGQTQACHHSLIAELRDNLLRNLKTYFYRQMQRTFEQGIRIDGQCLYLMLLMGIKGADISKCYEDIQKNPAHLQHYVDRLFEPLEASTSLLNGQSLVYYLNNHTLLGPWTLNFVDSLMEKYLRDDVLWVLKNISEGEDPVAVVELLQKKIAEVFPRIEKEITEYRETKLKLIQLFAELPAKMDPKNSSGIDDQVAYIDHLIDSLKKMTQYFYRVRQRDYVEDRLFSAHQYFKMHIQVGYSQYVDEIQASNSVITNLQNRLQDLDNQIQETKNKKLKYYLNIDGLTSEQLTEFVGFDGVEKVLQQQREKLQCEISGNQMVLRQRKSPGTALQDTLKNMFQELKSFAAVFSQGKSLPSDQEFQDMLNFAKQQFIGSQEMCNRLTKDLRLKRDDLLELQTLLIARTIFPREYSQESQ